MTSANVERLIRMLMAVEEELRAGAADPLDLANDAAAYAGRLLTASATELPTGALRSTVEVMDGPTGLEALVLAGQCKLALGGASVRTSELAAQALMSLRAAPAGIPCGALVASQVTHLAGLRPKYTPGPRRPGSRAPQLLPEPLLAIVEGSTSVGAARLVLATRVGDLAAQAERRSTELYG